MRLTRLPSKKDWKPVFLENYRESGNVKESAEAAGVSKQMAYKARKMNKAFREEWEAAREEVGDTLEAVAVSRAKDHSDTLLIFLLKGLKPETYGDKTRHAFDQDSPLRVTLKWE
jgi:hypothetical protein